MKNPARFLSICALAAVLLTTTGCVQDAPKRTVYSSRNVARSPYIGSPEWITWVDRKVDTRYANGIRPDPGSQEWYAIVNHVVFADYSRDYYRNAYRSQYRDDYRRYNTSRGSGARYNYADASDRGDHRRLRLGSVEWKRAVDAEILSGRVPPPPPRSDPWDTPLAPTSDR